MSRAEDRTLPPPPQIRRVVRGAVSDLYYNSWRFLGANILLGLTLILIVLAAVGSPWALGLLPIAAVPAAGMMRMATVLVRDGHADFSDVTAVLRRPWTALAVGTVQSAIALVLVVDMWLGAAIGSFTGALLSVSAVYGLVIWWAFAAVAWPLLLDPERQGVPIARRLRLAAVVLVAHPFRVGVVLVLVGAALALSLLMIAPFVTFAAALGWLMIARFVLPVADRIEGRRTLVLGG
ncbi:MAG: hypothetical protein M3Y40_01210 [Chloroflexota bacterium]|nr:hypothetical protein [Chloroflexota bacterium]